MSAILQVFRVSALITQIAVSLGRIVVQAVLLPFRILGAVFTTLLAIGTDFLRFVQSRQLSLAAVGIALLIVAVGTIGVFQTNFIIISQDVLYECVWSPLYEAVWKFGIKTIIGLSQILGAAWNTILEYIVVRGSMWYEDTADIIDCVLRTGDILRLLSLPTALWRFVYSLFFIFTTEGRLSRRQPVADAPLFYHSPNIDPVITAFLGPTNEFPDAKDMDGGFGAFGPAENVIETNFVSITQLILGNFYKDFAKIIGTTGELLTSIASDLQRPAGKFGLNFLLRTSAADSYFGRVGDILSRVISFVSFTWAYPPSGPFPEAGYSETRFKAEAVIVQIFRIIGSVLRFVFLIFNDLFTVNRPDPVGPECGGVDYTVTREVLALFKGLFIVDLFLLGEFNPGTLNLNIFRSNWEFCRINALMYHFPKTSGSMAGDSFAVYNSGAYESHAEKCGVLTNGTFPISIQGDILEPNQGFGFVANDDEWVNPFTDTSWIDLCNEWSGEGPIDVTNRIDYLGELFDIFKAILRLVIDPFDEPEPRKVFEETRIQVDVAEQFIDRALHSIIYTVDILGAPAIDTGNPIVDDVCRRYPLLFIYNYFLESSIVALFERVIWGGEESRLPGETENAQPFCFKVIQKNAGELREVMMRNQQNWILCFIGRLSVDVNNLFRLICTVLDFKIELFGVEIISAIQNMKCSFAKRSVPTLEEARRKAEMVASYWVRLGLSAHIIAMQFFSELRKNSALFDKCALSDDSVLALCHSECSLGPCVPPVFDCLAHGAPNNTFLYSGVVTYRGITQRAAMGVSLVADFVYGCPDSDLQAYFRWSSALLEMTRDFFVRFYTYVFDYSTAYSTCMEAADRARKEGKLAAEIERDYLRCVGAPVAFESPGAPLNESATYFRDSLQSSGISDDSGTCGWVLAQHGFLVDTDAPNSDTDAVFTALYRMCAFLHAFGARATSSGTSQRRLSDYVQGFQAPLALMSATARLDTTRAPVAQLLPGAAGAHDPAPTLREYLAPPTYKAPNKTLHWRVRALVRHIQKSITSSASMVAMGTYFADVHDEVLQNSHHMSIAEMDDREQELRQKATAKIANVVTDSEEVKQRFAKNMAKLHTTKQKVSTADVFDAVHRSMVWQTKTEQGAEYEAVVHFQRGGNLHPSRFVVNLHENATYARRVHHHGVPVSWGAASAVVRGTSANLRGDPSLLQAAAVAMRNVEHVHDVLVFKNGLHMTHAVRSSQVILSSAMRIVNRRLRLQALPPVQAALMTLDVLTNSDAQSLEAWSRGDLGYIVGEGFVAIEDYDLYMQEEQTQRERWSRAYSIGLSEEELIEAPLLSRRYATQLRLERERVRRRALPRRRITLCDVARCDLRRHNFFSRAKFLVRHNLAHTEEHVHVHAPHHWHFRHLALRANTSYERHEVLRLAASTSHFDSLEFAQMALDHITLDVTVDDFVESFTSFGERLWNAIFAALSDPSDFFTDIIVAAACPGPSAYRASGTETYTVGCVPYYPERILDFWEQFPQNFANKGLWSFIEGPGYIQWPAGMVRRECDVARVPDSICPNPQPFLWDAYVENEPPGRPGLDSSVLRDAVCLVDYCSVASGQASPNFPFCPVCDVCIRDYFSAFEKGFTTGFDVLLVWNALLRGWIRLVFSNDIFVTYFVILYPLIALYDIISLPFLGPVFSIGFPLIVPLGDALFFQRPERLLYPLYPLYALSFSFPFLGWAFWIFSLYPTIATAFTGSLYDTAPVLMFVDNFLPDAILITVLNFIPTIPLLDQIVDLSVLAPIATTLEMRRTSGATEEEALYSFYAFILVPVTLAVLYVGFYLLLNAFTIIGPIFSFIGIVLSELINIARTIFDYLLRSRVRQVRSDVAELQDTTEIAAVRNRRRLRDLEDEVEADKKQDAEEERRLRELASEVTRLKDE